MLGLALLLGGCAANVAPDEGLVFDPCGVTVVAAADSLPTELAGIDAGLQLWNDAAGLGATRVAGGEGAIPIRFALSIPAFFGRYQASEGSIVVNRDIDDPSVRAIVVAHELGHAFGLEHIPTQTELSLMNPANTTVPPTAGDVARVRALWGDCPSSGTGD